MQKFDVNEHVIVPKHSKVGEKEKNEILEKYKITLKELPRIFADDPAVAELGVKEDDVVKIARNSPTAGETLFFRRVVRG
ncbi:DNA-directed RNA polymerase subunit H [Candidatus Woesearchaeota archaeon]|nr:DNA-directed RNA polymerase subunit H [Candidatus Woesearchaeota archaeon]